MIGLPVATDHDRQCALLRAQTRTGNRGIQHSDSALSGGGLDILHRRNRYSAVNDENTARGHCRQHPAFAQSDLANAFVIEHADANNITIHAKLS